MAHHQKAMSFGMQARETESPKQVMREEDLLAHFENFDMEQLGGSGGMHPRSLIERQQLSPDKARNDQGLSYKEQLDHKKVRVLELETENGELKTMIEQLTKNAQAAPQQTVQQDEGLTE